MNRVWAPAVNPRVLGDRVLRFAAVAGFFIAMLYSAFALAQAPSSLRITDIHGQSWSGSLVSLDQESLVYKPLDATGSGDVVKKADEILSILRPGSKPTRSDASAWLAGLTDGSVLVAQKVEGKEKDWALQLGDTDIQNGFAGEFRYLKLKKLDSKAQESWDAYVRDEIKSDALIVVRPGGALDRVDGVVREIRDGKVQFDVDGQVVEASLDRLAGVLWYRKQSPSTPQGFQVQLSNGSTLVAQRASVKEQRLELEGAWGKPLSLPLEWLQGIDCGLDKMAWVASLPVLESRTYKKGGFGDFDAVLTRTWKPHWVEDERSGESLLFPGPGEYVFRAPQGMTKFTARIERADDSEAQSAVWTEVWVDDQVVLRKELGADQQGMDIDVGIAQEKKIKIVLGSKSALNLGTRVAFLQPRVSK